MNTIKNCLEVIKEDLTEEIKTNQKELESTEDLLARVEEGGLDNTTLEDLLEKL